MRKHICLLLPAICLFAMHIHAQQTPGERYAWSQKKYTFTIQPFQLINSGLKLDFEVRLGDGPGWLQFSPAVYYGTKDIYNIYDDDYYNRNRWKLRIREPYTKLKGGGLDVNYKHFMNPRRTFYTAAGVTYTHFSLSYWGFAWYDYIEDGLLYHGYMYDFHTQHIDRVGLNYYFGYQIPARRAFVYDMFWGLSCRHSYSDKNKLSYDDHVYSYGYSGLIFIAGIRIGFGLK